MPQQQAGYKAAILSLSFLSLTLQRGTGPYKGQGEGEPIQPQSPIQSPLPHGGEMRWTRPAFSTAS